MWGASQVTALAASGSILEARVSRTFALALMVDGPQILELADADPWQSSVRGTRRTQLSTLIAVESLAHRSTTIRDAALAAAKRTGVDCLDIEADLIALVELGVLQAGTADPAPMWGDEREVPFGGRPSESELLLTTPMMLGLDQQSYVLLNPEGCVIARLDAVDVAFISLFGKPTRIADALEGVRALLRDGFSEERSFELTTRLFAAGLLRDYDESDPAHLGSHGRQERELRSGLASFFRHRRALRIAIAEHDEQEIERTLQTGITRTRVVPVDRRGFSSPLAIGMLMAYAKTVDGGRLETHFDFFPRWLQREEDIDAIDRPSIFLFSNYIWSHNGNSEFSQLIKRQSPDSVTVHGGPDVPRARNDIDRYMRAHPDVDVVVRGEGEHSFVDLLGALQGSMGEGTTDLSVLEGVAGISYRDGDRLVHGPDRDRIADLDEISSPYLEGFFDTMAESGALGMAIFETNRGCPYSCTYCDWGAATNSRIRKFDLERVFAEIEWAAEAKIPFFTLADANFGIFARDVEIARKVAEVRERHGYPKRFATNFAKNTVKHLKEVIEIITGAGIFTEGLLSLQSMDSDTLEAIHRSNIKVEKYEDLAIQLRRAGLPLFVDLMMGLPGQTLQSFTNDVQECINREVTGKIFGTEMLVNSPMNDPAYRAEHQIQLIREPGPSDGADDSREHALVVSTATFTRDDYRDMNRLRRTFFLAENHGVLRQVSRHVRQAAGMREVDFLRMLNDTVRADRERYPALTVTLLGVPDLLAPPISWALFIDEIRTLLVTEVGVPDDSALATVLRVQHALLPASGRSFPMTVELEHDYAAWHSAMLDAKEAGHLADWTDHVAPLSSYGPAPFTVTDDDRVCELSLGYSVELDTSTSWELTSPVARAMPASFAMVE